MLEDDEGTSTEFEDCCVEITGTFTNILRTELTATYARYLKLFTGVCGALDLEVFIEIREGEESTCEVDVTCNVKNGSTVVTTIGFNASFGFGEGCEDWNNFALSFATHSSSASMGCAETGLGATLTAV